jgi:hypothetical protein
MGLSHDLPRELALATAQDAAAHIADTPVFGRSIQKKETASILLFPRGCGIVRFRTLWTRSNVNAT